MFGNNHTMLLPPTTNHINRFMLMYLHIRLGCKDIVSNSLWCHPPQWHLVLEGGHILGCAGSGPVAVGGVHEQGEKLDTGGLAGVVQIALMVHLSPSL